VVESTESSSADVVAAIEQLGNRIVDALRNEMSLVRQVRSFPFYIIREQPANL
jgi:hypothetical protein